MKTISFEPDDRLRRGRVAEVACRPGETVSAGKRLLPIEPDPVGSDTPEAIEGDAHG